MKFKRTYCTNELFFQTNRFVIDYNEDGDTEDKGANIMKCFDAQSVPSISTMATQFGTFDSWHASFPGMSQILYQGQTRM